MRDGAGAEKVGPPGVRNGLPRWLPLLTLVLLLSVVLAFGLHRHLSLEALAEQRRTLQAFIERQPLGALLAYAGIYVAVAALSLPGGAVLTVAGGFLFGVPTGWLTAAASVSLGAVIFFLAARTALGDIVRRRAGPRVADLAEGLCSDAAPHLLALRLTPFIPSCIVNMAASIVGVRLRTFAWTTFVGILPISLVLALTGRGLDAVLAAQASTAHACTAAGRTDCRVELSLFGLVTAELALALATLSAVALVPVFVTRVRVGARRSVERN